MSFGEAPISTSMPRFLELTFANRASNPRRNNSAIARCSPVELAGTRGLRFLSFLSAAISFIAGPLRRARRA
jgi:hypothetical protein